MKSIKQFLMSILLVFILACGSNKENTLTNSGNNKLKVTTTLTFFQDLVKQIGGDKVEVTGIMGEGEDPHLYNAKPKDHDKLESADLVVYGGLHLEGKMSDIFEKLEKTKEVLNLGDSVDKNLIRYSESNVPDPHVWFSINIYKQEAKALANKLSMLDPENKDYYMNNFNLYEKELNELDKYIKSRISEIPEGQRKLITAHDAFAYYAEDFGLEVKAIQGVSTDSETGAKNISDLATYIVENNIKAIFVESSVPKKSIEALQEAVKSRGHEVKIGGELYSDSMGDKEHNTDTYIKTVKANTDTIVNALK